MVAVRAADLALELADVHLAAFDVEWANLRDRGPEASPEEQATVIELGKYLKEYHCDKKTGVYADPHKGVAAFWSWVRMHDPAIKEDRRYEPAILELLFQFFELRPASEVLCSPGAAPVAEAAAKEAVVSTVGHSGKIGDESGASVTLYGVGLSKRAIEKIARGYLAFRRMLASGAADAICNYFANDSLPPVKGKLVWGPVMLARQASAVRAYRVCIAAQRLKQLVISKPVDSPLYNLYVAASASAALLWLKPAPKFQNALYQLMQLSTWLDHCSPDAWVDTDGQDGLQCVNAPSIAGGSVLELAPRGQVCPEVVKKRNRGRPREIDNAMFKELVEYRRNYISSKGVPGFDLEAWLRQQKIRRKEHDRRMNNTTPSKSRLRKSTE